MPKLFFRKKNKKKHHTIKDALATLPAFVAVPSSPPPGSRSATQQQQDLLNSTLTSTIGTQSQWPYEEQQHHNPRHTRTHSLPDLPLSEDEDEDVPGYASVRRPQNERNDLLSHRARESTPPKSQASPRAGTSSLPRDRLLSTSELPSVTSGLSLHSDSSDNFIFHPPHTSPSPQVPPVQNTLDEKISQLYAKVRKPKKSTELPPKAPLSSSNSPPQHTGRHKENVRHKDTIDYSPQHNERRRYSSLRERPFPTDFHRHDDKLTPEYSDEDYLPSDDTSESMPSPHVVTKKHHRSPSSHHLHQPPSPNTTIHPSTTQNQTYFFSEKQPDGSVQYYTARPVLSPAPPSPTSLLPYNQPALVESGYYSNVPATLLFQPTSPVGPGSRLDMPSGASTAPPKSSSRPHTEKDSSSLTQKARSHRPPATSGHSSSHSRGAGTSYRDTATSPIGRMLEGKSSLERKRLHKEMGALYEEREARLKAQIAQLEATNNELVEKNETLKRQYHTSRRNAAESSESLQEQISTLKTENSKSDLCISKYELELSQLKEEVSRLQEENKYMLQVSMSEESSWEGVAAHAKSVLQENSSLLEQQEVQRDRLWETKKEHQTALQQLKTEISKLRKERAAMREEVASLREGHSLLKERLNSLGSQAATQVTMEEHQQAMEEVQSLLEELAVKTESDTKLQETRLRVLQKEKKELVSSVTELNGVIMRLEAENTSLQKAKRKLLDRLAGLQSEVEEYRDREVATHHQLSQATALAERAMTERDTFAKIAKSQQKAQDRSSQLVATNKQAFRDVEHRLQSYKTQANHKLDRASLLLKEHERQQRSERRVHEEEMKHLKALLEARQFHCQQLAKGSHLSSTLQHNT